MNTEEAYKWNAVFLQVIGTMVGPMEGIVEGNVAAVEKAIHSSKDESMAKDSDGSDASSEHHKAKEVRKNGNVSELVAKSKKAASSLWTLLHAKVRTTRIHTQL